MALRKFECLNCHQRFEADDKDTVLCPKCQSDNVEFAHFHMPKGVWKWGATIVGCAILLLALYAVIGTREETEPGVTANIDTDSLYEEVSQEMDSIVSVETNLALPPKIISKDPVFDGKGYSFGVMVKNAPQRPFRVVLVAHNDSKKIIASSDDGKFVNIPPSEAEGGQYDLVLMDAKSDSLLSAPTPKAGFIRQTVVTKKMSKEQLQELIMKGDESLMGVGESDYIAPNCALHCTGLSADDVQPKFLYDVSEKLENGVWSKIVVTAVSYDDKNRINSVEIKVEK